MSAWAEEGTTTMITCAFSTASCMLEVTPASLPKPWISPLLEDRSMPPRSATSSMCVQLRL